MAATKAAPAVTLRDFAGIRNDRLVESYEPTDLIEAVNIDLVDKGLIVRRDGYTLKRSAAAAHSLFATRDEALCLYGQGDGLYSLAEDLSTSTKLAGGLSPGLPIAYAEHAGRVYWTNAVQSGVIESGRARGWGLPQAQPPSVARASGVLPSGTYQVAVTLLRDDGQESGCGAGVSIELPDGGGIAVTPQAVTHPDVIGHVVYLTTANGTVLFEAARIGLGQTATIATPGERLQRPLVTQYYGAPPAGQCLAFYRGRLYVAVGNLVFYSAPFGLELFRPLDHIALKSAVRMIAPVTNGLFISDDTDTYFFSGATPEQFNVTRVQPYPAIAGSVAYAPAGLILELQGETPTPIWLSEKGVVVGTQDGGVNNVTERWRFTAPARAAATFKQNGAGDWQYVAALS